MNHPKHEEWVPYLFGEAAPDARRQLKQHLQTCAACREELESWQRSLGRLDAWRLPRVAGPGETFQPFLRWVAAAAAVVVVLPLAFGLGRLTSARADLAQVRAAIEPEIRQQLRQEFARMLQDELARSASATLAASSEQTQGLLAAYAQALEKRRLEDKQAVSESLDKLDRARVADLVSLKRELDTVAVNTDAGLRTAEQQLAEFASSARPPDSQTPSPQ